MFYVATIYPLGVYVNWFINIATHVSAVNRYQEGCWMLNKGCWMNRMKYYFPCDILLSEVFILLRGLS